MSRVKIPTTAEIVCAQPMLPPGINLCPYTLDPETGEFVAVLFAEPRMTNDEKALRYDLDSVGIESRAAEGVELVELRAEVQRMRAALRNVLLLTMQRKPFVPEDVAEKLLRFCREGGEEPSILRNTDSD